MRRKQTWVLFLIALVLLVSYGCHAMEETDNTLEPQGLFWIREESGLVDYTICDDTIQFRYAFRFENNSENNVILSCLNAKFIKSELGGWLQYEKFYPGVLENGDFAATIKAGEKITLIYVFSGAYLGGSVCENLSAPDITMILDYE